MLDVARDHARRHGVPDDPGPAPAPDARMPAVGTTASRTFVVTSDDTAAAMGHPDAGMAVLASPRLALWFELVSGDTLPAPGDTTSHVGSGILLHHLGPARVGDTVEVRVEVATVAGRTVGLTCDARVGDDLVGTGSHQRVLLA
ncbi:thioesterase family protein [Salsipaludibacter albus]|uniref:thioesterase family protein n=1 Tax=Salsipaludibacter albus TaxID=2849650 RepID=UPI001EE45C2D|nr:hotdog domain-containing protein [Salsipaludibacter albus]MBY5162504.1 dihydrolipoamide acyltransferase [Salsipaludibacter albus]